MNNRKIIAWPSLMIFVFYGLSAAQMPPASPPPESTALSPGDTLAKPVQQPPRKIAPGKGRIQFDEIDFDFGSIQKGAQVTHNFWFTNIGIEDLTITNIKPACGCTTTKLKGMTVPPNGRGSIDISFNSDRFNSILTKGIAVQTNDALNPYMDIRFTANINNPLQNLETNPLEANFQTVPVGKSRTISVKLTNIDSTESKLVIVEKPSGEFIKTQLAKKKLKPGASTEIKFTLAKNIPAGPFVSSLTIEAQEKADSRITIPILGTIGDNSTPPTMGSSGK
jgi:hypothetical protein